MKNKVLEQVIDEVEVLRMTAKLSIDDSKLPGDREGERTGTGSGGTPKPGFS